MILLIRLLLSILIFIGLGYGVLNDSDVVFDIASFGAWGFFVYEIFTFVENQKGENYKFESDNQLMLDITFSLLSSSIVAFGLFLSAEVILASVIMCLTVINISYVMKQRKKYENT